MNEKELGQEHGTGILTNIYLLKANNRNTRKRFHDVILVFLLLHLIPFSTVSIVDFEQVNVGLDVYFDNQS